MSRGPADDDDDLPIEIAADDLPELLEGPLESGPVATPAAAPTPVAVPPPPLSAAISAMISGPTSLSTHAPAGELEPRAEADLYLAEAQLAEPARAAPLLHEAAHLRATALGDGDAALATHRDALARDPSFVASLGPLRRLLSARGQWAELVAVYDRLLRGGAFGADAGRSRRIADLWVERGRILEDRLERFAEAAAGYLDATVAAPEHATVQLARLIGAARARDAEGVEAALAGLLECADDPGRRAALAAELARAQRLGASGAGGAAAAGADEGPAVPEALAPGEALTPTPTPTPTGAEDTAPETVAAGVARGPARALETLREALPGASEETPAGDLVAELEELARLRTEPRIQVGALEELARVQPVSQRAAKVALHRERARVLRDVLADAAGAHAALADARQLAPEHPLLTADMLDVAEQADSAELLARTLETSAIPEDELASALRFEDALARTGRRSQALELVQKYRDGWSADPSSPMALAALAARIALAAEGGDADALAEAFEAEGEVGQGIAAAHALVRAATLRERSLHDLARAEGLYRRALARQPGYAPAVDALEQLLRTGARWAELAQLLEGDLAVLPQGEEHAPRRRYLLAALVGLYRDRLGDPARALVHQRARVELDPVELDAWIARRDLELAVTVADDDPNRVGSLRREGVATLIELAMRAGEPAVTAALETEAAGLVTGDPGLAERFYRDAAGDDRTGIATGHLTALLPSAGERCRVLAGELAAAEAAGRTEVARALRHRLAAERAGAGEWKEAIAALVPVASAGDEQARAFGFDRARRSGVPALELAVLGEDGAAAGAAGLTVPSDRGEALERAGNGEAAQAAFREALQRGRSPDAALGLLRTAAAAGNLDGVVEALRALGDTTADDDSAGPNASVAAAARRERELLEAARGTRGVAVPGSAAPAPTPDLGDALRDWVQGVRAGDHAQVAGALVDLAARAAPALDPARATREVPALLTRALARSRLAGRGTAAELHRRAWAIAPGNAAVAHAISDVREDFGLSGGAASGLPDTRSDRSARLPLSAATLATELDLERALEQEAAGHLGEALDVYARVLARDPDCLEAMLGVGRLARAGGDQVGEARALVRQAALVKSSAHAARLFLDAAGLFERAGRRDDAIAAYLKVLEHAPDDDAGFERLASLLRASIESPGSAKTLDRVLGHRLQLRGPSAGPDEVLALLFERADNRLDRLEDRGNAIEDFKRILKLDPHNPRALRRLATLAIDMRHPADAARLLERYLAVAPHDDGGAAQAAARLELAAAREAAGDRPHALEALRDAAAARPRDPVPLQRMTELHQRAGDWRSAIVALRAWEALLDEPSGKADLELRIGTLLRDEAFDLPQAAQAFRRAAELDSLGEGTRELARLYERDEVGRIAVMERAVAEMRAELLPDPLHVPRLRRLQTLLQEAWRDGRGRDGVRAVADVLALLGESGAVAPAPVPAPFVPAGAPSAAFWTALTDEPALGFMTEVWMLLADAIAELHPPDLAALGAVRQSRIQGADEPGLEWVIRTAASLGLPELVFHRSTVAGGVVGADQAHAAELPAPLLVFGAATRFDGKSSPSPYWVGRALGLLRLRATALTRLAASDLQQIFAAAAVLAGAEPSAATGEPDEARVKGLFKTLARKDRKALQLQASRFGFERLDAAAWQRAVLRAADRLGLIVAGHAGAAAAAAAGMPIPAPAGLVRRSDPAMDLVRFALGERYLAARRATGQDRV